MGDLSLNFSRDEFACPWSGLADMDAPFIKRLQRARTQAGIAFIISEGGGFRSYQYNSFIGGVAGSAHTKGLAADILVKGSREAFIIMSALIGEGFTRVGWNQRRKFIHVDDDPTKPQQVLWGYTEGD